MAYRQDPLTIRFNPLRYANRESVWHWLENSGTEWSDLEMGKDLFWFLKYQGNIVGNALLISYNSQSLTAEIGYGIFFGHRGQGLASAALAQLIHRIFTETTIRKLVAHIHEDNLASQRVIEKQGFTREGLLREHYLICGRPANHVAYGLLAKEFSPS